MIHESQAQCGNMLLKTSKRQRNESSKAYFHTRPEIRWSYKLDECKNMILTLQIIFYIENCIHMKDSVFTEAYKRSSTAECTNSGSRAN